MKKLVFVMALSLAGSTAAFSAAPVQPSMVKVDQVVQMKVINDTGADFQYKVGADIYTIVAGTSVGFSFEENTQILKKNSGGEWVNWFVITSSHQGQSAMLSALLS